MYIGGKRIIRWFHDFGSHVAGRASVTAQSQCASLIAFLHSPCQPKIKQLDDAIVVETNVSRFNISINNPLTVQEVQCMSNAYARLIHPAILSVQLFFATLGELKKRSYGNLAVASLCSIPSCETMFQSFRNALEYHESRHGVFPKASWECL